MRLLLLILAAAWVVGLHAEIEVPASQSEWMKLTFHPAGSIASTSFTVLAVDVDFSALKLTVNGTRTVPLTNQTSTELQSLLSEVLRIDCGKGRHVPVEMPHVPPPLQWAMAATPDHDVGPGGVLRWAQGLQPQTRSVVLPWMPQEWINDLATLSQGGVQVGRHTAVFVATAGQFAFMNAADARSPPACRLFAVSAVRDGISLRLDVSPKTGKVSPVVHNHDAVHIFQQATQQPPGNHTQPRKPRSPLGTHTHPHTTATNSNSSRLDNLALLSTSAQSIGAVLNPIVNTILAPVFDQTFGMVTAESQPLINDALGHGGLGGVPPIVTDYLTYILKRNLTHLLTDAVTESITTRLCIEMSNALGSVLTSKISAVVIPALEDKLWELLNSQIPAKLHANLPGMLEQSLALQTLPKLTQTLTHTLTMSLLRSVGFRDTQHLADSCRKCYVWSRGSQHTALLTDQYASEAQRRQCGLCRTYLGMVQHTHYYGGYYADYFGSYYAKYYTAALKKVVDLQYKSNNDEHESGTA